MDDHRYVKEKDLLRQVEKVVAAGAAEDAALGSFGRWLQKQRTLPDLVGATRAAEMLGVKAPYITRLRAQGRLPEPVPVEGSVTVYLREEIEALAAELEQAREARKAKAP